MQEEYLKPKDKETERFFCQLATDCEKQKNSVKKFICKADYVVPGFF